MPLPAALHAPVFLICVYWHTDGKIETKLRSFLNVRKSRLRTMVAVFGLGEMELVVFRISGMDWWMPESSAAPFLMCLTVDNVDTKRRRVAINDLVCIEEIHHSDIDAQLSAEYQTTKITITWGVYCGGGKKRGQESGHGRQRNPVRTNSRKSCRSRINFSLVIFEG